MNESIFIVIWRTGKTAKWQPASDGVLESRRLAENYIELKKAVGNRLDFAIVEGPIVSPELMAEAELALGKF